MLARPMLAEAFRRFQEPVPSRHATEFSTAPDMPDGVHELSQVLARLVESQELLIKEVREVARRPDAPCDEPDNGGGAVVTYDWTPPPRSPSPW